MDGSYLRIDDASDDYDVEQTGAGGPSYTLTITGTNAYTDTDEGNTVTGVYTRTKTGTDVWEMEITGTKIGGSYYQDITGSEDYTLVDEGNLSTGHYERTITGAGSYDRTTTGAGSTLPTDADDYAYTWEQTGDPTSGYFTLDQSGTVRYDLLEDFFDISNTSAGQSPGHMNIYPFGQTFVDPGPGIYPNDFVQRMQNDQYRRGFNSTIGHAYMGAAALTGGAFVVTQAPAVLYLGYRAIASQLATRISYNAAYPAIARAFFQGQQLANTPQNVTALRWYLQIARDILTRYAAEGYTGTGVATQTQRVQRILQQFAQWGVAP